MKAHLRKPEPVRKAWGPHDTAWGRYGQQYFYACMRCGERAVPAITPAAAAIDWDLPATVIGDRAKPLEPNTMARIQRGLDLIPHRPMVVPLDYLTEPASKVCRDATGNVLQTMHGQHKAGLVVQVSGNLGRLHADGTIDRIAAAKSWSTDEALRTIHGSIDKGIVIPDVGGNPRKPRTTEDTLPTMLTRETTGLVVAMRESAVPKTADGAPLPTATTINSLYALGLPRLVVSNMSSEGSIKAPTVDTDDSLTTVTTGNKLYAVDPWIVPMRRNTRATSATDAELPTITTGGGKGGSQTYLLKPPVPAGVVIANNGGPATKYQGHVRDAHSNVLGTQTGGGQHSLVTSTIPDIMECTFRMLEPSEIARGMMMQYTATGALYVIHGGRRDQVKQLGNAVTPPPMRRIVQGVYDSLAA